jgi:hypothetical protein
MKVVEVVEVVPMMDGLVSNLELQQHLWKKLHGETHYEANHIYARRPQWGRV